MMYPPPQIQALNVYDSYRLKTFRAILDRKYEAILNPNDAMTYRHVDRLYYFGFWGCLSSIPVNYYFGRQMSKFPAQAKSFMMKSLFYTTFSTVMFASALFRYQGYTKDLASRYLTNMSTPELESYLNQIKGVYAPPQPNPYAPQPNYGMLQHIPGPPQAIIHASPSAIPMHQQHH
jgi:hypothetical protein